MPGLVYAAIRGSKEPSLPLAIATTLLYLGIDVCDDLSDGDRPASWNGYSLSEINLAAMTLLSTLPQIAIAELEVLANIKLAMLKSLAQGLLTMSAGQQTDLSTKRQVVVTAAEVEKSVQEKSGEEVALFASLAAQFAGAEPNLVQTYAALGRAIGTAGQLSSDCHDLFRMPMSRDFLQGTRTLPIALYLEKKTEGERFFLLSLLDKKQPTADDLQKVRALLSESGIFMLVSFIVETYCQRALRLLNSTGPRDPAGQELRTAIAMVSFHAKGGKNELSSHGTIG